MRSKLILLGVFVGLLQICYAQVNQKSECKANEEYCQNHWECCSNSCYSYLYKCVHNSQQRPQSQTVQLSQVPQAAGAPSIVSTPVINIPPPPGINFNKPVLSIEDLINSLFAPTPRPDFYQDFLSNRFSGNPTTTEASALPSTECLEIGKKCFRNSECCTSRCHGFLHQCVT